MKLFFCISWHSYLLLSQQNTFMASTVIVSQDISKLFKTSFVIHPLQFDKEKKLRWCDHTLKYFELFLSSLLYSFLSTGREKKFKVVRSPSLPSTSKLSMPSFLVYPLKMRPRYFRSFHSTNASITLLLSWPKASWLL